MKNKTYKRITDNDLMLSAKDGSQTAFAELYKRYFEKIRNYVSSHIWNREDAEDVVQDVFLKVFELKSGWKARFRFKNYIYRTAHNAVWNWNRNTKSQNTVPVGENIDLVLADHRLDADACFESGMGSTDLYSAIDRLSYDLGITITLFLNRYSYQRIADMLLIPIGTVMSRINTARTRLSAMLRNR